MTKKKLVGIALASMMAISLAACGDTDTSSTAESKAAASNAETTAAESEKSEGTDAVVEDTPAADDGAAGFTEYPIFEDEEVGFLNVSAVYFQPVPMSNGNEKVDGFNIHLEADVSALENDLGFGVGDWVPYMTVDYKITGSDGNVAAEGTFMVMSASDGPHYGANVALPDADTYSIEFQFHNPEENGYLLHTDAETGPGGNFDEYFKDGNLKVTFDGWDYVPQEW
ncbi:iron transporter [Ruminococcus albus]|uniref:Putative lipoprotein n=1 Tax=Ruminococcus albus 8 TaxID=246199 RepID=E9SCE6_RUMAL|nr:iron transporter [Ruminococcus albus]EGC02986.1 putative lipoprotein [Ruminococcus albus 8]MCC3352306.1 iron transporter [Ruminococcus albus 8]